jgi:hypothetical protein
MPAINRRYKEKLFLIGLNVATQVFAAQLGVLLQSASRPDVMLVREATPNDPVPRPLTVDPANPPESGIVRVSAYPSEVAFRAPAPEPRSIAAWCERDLTPPVQLPERLLPWRGEIFPDLMPEAPLPLLRTMRGR